MGAAQGAMSRRPGSGASATEAAKRTALAEAALADE